MTARHYSFFLSSFAAYEHALPHSVS